MATHFARGILTEGRLVSARISSACHREALTLPEHRRSRFLASRALLAELMFMLYGTSELPDIITQPEGRPVFADPDLPRFSIAYTGNIIGVALTTEGDCGLDMELQRATRSFHGGNAHEDYPPAMRSCGYATRTILLKPEPSSLPCARAFASSADAPQTTPACCSCCLVPDVCAPSRPRW